LGIQVHYHNHAGSYIETPGEVAALVAHIELSLVDLCFDTGHYAYGGGDANEFVASHLDSIGYLHLKDVNRKVLTEAKQRGWSFLDALRHIIFCPLGEGDANIPSIVATLVNSRFNGWVIIEQDTCKGESTLNARNNRETLARLAVDPGNRKEPES
ncbi:MAG TPA: sugar phosphate isomerase/epimerase, partial [Thermomicrobiales bacterium]|nr:sugar phosphate isomerase/epimerase [Thermomicrobiales bacterium]